MTGVVGGKLLPITDGSRETNYRRIKMVKG